MARDTDETPLHKGDVVVCVVEGEGVFVKNGQKYVIVDVREIKIKLEGWPYWWSSDRFRKDAGIGGTAEAKTDRIMALINGRPWSPSRDEILEILRS